MVFNGLFVAEGTSDMPLSALAEDLFGERGVRLRLTSPDFNQLRTKVDRDVRSRVEAGITLMGRTPDVVVVHRDADNVGAETRRREITEALGRIDPDLVFCPVIPVRMTEAWLLLDEPTIRQVAGNPRGRNDLRLPSVREVERVTDPKQRLHECLLAASAATGRRRERNATRFANHRRQLLKRIDRHGPVTRLPSWQQLVDDVEKIAASWHG